MTNLNIPHLNGGQKYRNGHLLRKVSLKMAEAQQILTSSAGGLGGHHQVTKSQTAEGEIILRVLQAY